VRHRTASELIGTNRAFAGSHRRYPAISPPASASRSISFAEAIDLFTEAIDLLTEAIDLLAGEIDGTNDQARP
jgi:hypothetical protein